MLNHPVQEYNQALLEQMEITLAHLAMHWRGHPEPNVEKDIVHRYRSILSCMLELGLDHPLDIDSELPHELMPEAYLKRFA